MRNKFLEKVYSLQSIKRFSNRNVVVHHSPAEHSYYVALLALYIAEHENLKLDEKDQYDEEILLKKALCHDVPESVTGDILYPTKHFNEEINKKIAEVEDVVTRENLLKWLPKELQDRFYDHIINCKEGKEGVLIAFCDQLESLYYITEERKLGNQSPWIDDVFKAVTGVCDNWSKNNDNGTARRLYGHIVEEFNKYSGTSDKID